MFYTNRSTINNKQTVLHCLALTCDDAGVEVESHLAAVLENDGLHQVTVTLEANLMSLTPETRIEEA